VDLQAEELWGVSAETPAVSASRDVAAGSVLQQREDSSRRAFNRAEALVSIAQAYVRGDRPNRAPIEVVVTVPASSLREAAADPMDAACMGTSCLSPEAARRLSCDAGVVDVVEDEHGVPLSVGRKRRTIAGSIKRALLKRDTACTFPGCTHSMYLEGHHIRHWADGGETSLENGLLLCSLHHRFVHEYGYAIELGVDQRPQFREPSGRVVQAVPPAAVGADIGWPRLRREQEALAISAETIACGWDGKPVDYGMIVDDLVRADGLV
jgi:hypothetical protein